LLGKDAPNLSPAVIARLTAEWQADYDAWQKRDLSARRYVYVWADGVYLQARMEDNAECMLVLICATPEGRKALVGFQPRVPACGRARRAGASSSSTSSGAGSRSRRISPWGTARSASGRQSMRSFPAPGTSGVGFIRPPTCSTRSPARSRST